MRLPWLQVDADGMTRGEMLGRLLGIGPDAGIGLVMRVWRWALEMAPDGDFSGGPHDPVALAAGIGWPPNEASKLAEELARSGLADVAGSVPVSAGSVRIRGLDRYRRAWERNQRRKPAPVAPVTGANPAPTTNKPARKTETETETETEKKETKPAPASPARNLELLPVELTALVDHGEGWKELVDALFAAFVEVNGKPPEPRGKDWKALKRLRQRTKSDDAEIIARFRRGLVAQFKQHVDSFWDLDDRWDALVSTGPPTNVRKGVMNATDAEFAASAASTEPQPF